MPTSKDSPTAGELAQDDRPDATEQIATTEGQEVVVDEAPAETNFPEAAPEAEDAPETAEDPDADPEPQDGEVWAVYTGQQPSQRMLTVEDLRSLGDKKATEPLVWDRNNRYRLEVSGVHPMVLEYIEHLDGNFRVVRPE